MKAATRPTVGIRTGRHPRQIRSTHAQCTAPAVLAYFGLLLGLCLPVISGTGASASSPSTYALPPTLSTPALTMAERLQLLQLDAEASGAVMPANDADDGELTWALAPRARAKLNETGKWLDLPNNNLTFTLSRESHVIVRYILLVVANRQYQAGGEFTNMAQSFLDKPKDYVGARLQLDGVPYRQSGSHAAPLSSVEVSTHQLSGYIVTRLGAGTHVVKLQWRKWGSRVTSWTANPSFRDGFVSGRSLTVSSRHRYLWFAQPLSVARSAISSNEWSTVKDMQLTFSLPRRWTLRFAYALQVRPQGLSRSDSVSGMDFLSTRIVLDGQAYRESSTVTSSATKTYGCSTLSGEVTLSIPAGMHTVRLE